MTSKNLLALNLGGGMDGLNFMSHRDAASVALIQTHRQSAPLNILNYVEAPSLVVNLVKDQLTFTSTEANPAVVGDLCYGDGLPRTRKVTIASAVTDGGTGVTTFTLSAAPYETKNGTRLYFSSATELFKMNETPAIDLAGTPCNPALHFNCRWLADAFNVADTVPNATKTKAAVISLIGPLVKRVYKASPSGGIFGLMVDNGSGGYRTLQASELVKNLTSHNDQTSTWLANAPEGAIEGWGGGIADTYLDELPNDLQRGLAAVSLETGTPFTAGTNASTYNASANSVLLKYPGFDSAAWPLGKESVTVMNELTDIIKRAAVLQPAADVNDFYASTKKFNDSAEVFQPILKNAPAMTSIPSTGPAALMGSLRQVARLLLMNNPNRGVHLTRSGNTVTATTEVSNATATRVAGTTTVTVTLANHGLFTSNTSTADLTDSVIVTGVDASTPAAGYKITLVPSDINNKFTLTSTANTALTDAPVTVRLKHNFTVENKVYVVDAPEAVDSVAMPDGFQVLTVPNEYTFTFATASSGAFTGGTILAKAKLINLPKQIFYATTAGFSWDTHNEANTAPLLALDQALTYFNDIADRIRDADLVGFSITEFGRTFSTNSTGGTDHGWGNHAFVWGKSVKGNRIYGDALDYSLTGPHVGTNMLIPTTSVYQYGATLAKWMGSTDAEILELFPKLTNWPANERYLGFL